LIGPFTGTPVMTVKEGSPFNTTADLIEYMKANPGRARFGSTGVGAVNHVATEMFEAAAGVEGVHVPYAGIAPVYNDLLAGTIDFTAGGVPPLPEGLTAIGSSGTQRHPFYPDKPTLEEVGVQNAAWDLWWGFLAPADLPQPIADKLIEEISAVLEEPEVIKKFETVSNIAPDAEPTTGEAFKQKLMEDNARWQTVVDREQIVVEQ
jgi:tripartite-type tricarboxylate transporter receptor subunit TctC